MLKNSHVCIIFRKSYNITSNIVVNVFVLFSRIGLNCCLNADTQKPKFVVFILENNSKSSFCLFKSFVN